MTTTTTTTTLPKNRTRIFAGNTLEAIRNQKNVIPPLSHQYRQGDSANLPAEQNRLARNGSQPYYSHPTAMGTRNGFRPSVIRRPKSRISATMTPGDNSYRDSRENSSKDLFATTLSSARLKSEINQLNSQLKIYGDLNRILRLQNDRDASATSQSALSHSTSYRISSASTNQAASRLHQRFPSALTNITSNGTVTDISDKSVAAPSSQVDDEENSPRDIDHQMTHTFQIPQQLNIGSDSVFPLNPPPPPPPSATSTTRSIKSSRRSDGNKPVYCPFYIMYFTNLAMQHRSNRVSSVASTTARKGSATSSRRQVQSPISMNTYSTIDDDNDSTVNTTSYYNQKRFSAKIDAFERENSHLLKDILRTTSWNHVQV